MRIRPAIITLLFCFVFSVFLSGCDRSDMRITRTPDLMSLETTIATEPSIITVDQEKLDEIVSYKPIYPDAVPRIREDLPAASAEERAAVNNWICLNEYLLPAEGIGGKILDGDLKTGVSGPYAGVYLYFDREVDVRAVEFTFQNNIFPINMKFLLGSRLYSEQFELYTMTPTDSVTSSKIGSDFVFPNNTVWIELNENINQYADTLIKPGDFFQCRCDVDTVPLVDIRIYGTVVE